MHVVDAESILLHREFFMLCYEFYFCALDITFFCKSVDSI